MPVRSDVAAVHHERTFDVTSGAIERYAAAVDDPSTLPIAPPLFAIVPGWDAMESCVRDALSDDLLLRILHLTQDMRFVRPISSGDRLVSRGRIAGVEGGRRTTTLVVHVTTSAQDGEAVGEFYAGIYVAGHGGEETSGESVPEFKASKSGDEVATIEQTVARDQMRRYAEASGDQNPIHLDDEVARSVGHPGVILHGMCTLAFAARAAVQGVCGGDVGRLARIAARFSKPVFPRQTLATTLWPSSDAGAYAFETNSPDGAAIRHGRVEVR